MAQLVRALRVRVVLVFVVSKVFLLTVVVAGEYGKAPMPNNRKS